MTYPVYNAGSPRQLWVFAAIGQNFFKSLVIFTVLLTVWFTVTHVIMEYWIKYTEPFFEASLAHNSNNSLMTVLGIFSGIAIFRWQTAITSDRQYKVNKRAFTMLNAGYVTSMAGSKKYDSLQNYNPRFGSDDLDYFFAYPSTFATQNIGFFWVNVQQAMGSCVALLNMKEEASWRHFLFFFVMARYFFFMPFFMYSPGSFVDSLVWYVYYVVIHLGEVLILYQAEELTSSIIKQDCVNHDIRTQQLYDDLKKIS